MSNTPQVSIIMPTFNSGKYIASAIASAVEQTFTQWELLILDDGSTDDTAEVVAPFLNDSRIQYLKQENMGQPKTRNRGVRMARGNFIAWLDADDVWKPSKLERQVAIFANHPDVGVCGTAREMISPAGEVFGVSKTAEFYGRAVPALLTGKLAIAMSSSVTRREVFETIGYFDEGFLPFSMDYDFWLRASLKFMFYYTDEKLVQYRTGHASISQQGADKRRTLVMSIVVPRFVREYGGDKYVKWHHLWQFRSDCYFGRAMGKESWLPRTHWLVRSLLYWPLNRDALGAFARQFFPGR